MGKHDEEIARLEAKHKPRGYYDRAYLEGYTAWRDGLGIAACPYLVFSIKESYWMRGWHESGVDFRRAKRGWEVKPPEPKDDPEFDLVEGESEE